LNSTARSLELGKVEGGFKSKFKNVEIVFHGFDELRTVQVAGKSLAPTTRLFHLQKPASLTGETTRNPALTVRNALETVRITW
jgi:hypothetical protein